jgi:hypothetical protein
MGMMLRRHKMSISEEINEVQNEAPAIDLSEMKYDELRAYAKKQGIDIKKYSTKTEMIEQLTH